jgi:hypothetical protein
VYNIEQNNKNGKKTVVKLENYIDEDNDGKKLGRGR